MSAHWLKVFVVSVYLLAPFAQAEILRPKLRPNPTNKKESSRSQTRRGETAQQDDDDDLMHHTHFSVLLITPLGKENFYDARFSALGNQFLVSFLLTKLGSDLPLHLETGLGYTFSRLTLTQPSTTFTHLYFQLPIRGKLLYQLSPTLILEGLLGVIVRPFEYDSRPTNDGGFRSAQDSVFDLDVAVGLSVSISSSLLLRFSAGYQYLGAGVMFGL